MILAIVQARVSSTRLPNKVLMPILGKPMLIRQIERIKRAKKIDQLVIATSTDETDIKIVQLCNDYQINVFRGPLEDVLERFYLAARSYDPTHVVRLTADCPLIDPEIIDQVITFHLQGNYDYTSNTLEPTFPDGLDVEVFRYNCLKRAYENAVLPSEREHVTPYFYNHPDLFKIGVYKNHINLSFYRWTVDEIEDFQLVEKIYDELYGLIPEFSIADVLKWLDKNPEWKYINKKYRRNEGYNKSLLDDINYNNNRKFTKE